MLTTELPEPVVSMFERDGACHLQQALSAPELQAIEEALAGLPVGQAGIRLHGIAKLNCFFRSESSLRSVAACVLGEECRAVRAILFDKCAENNWSLPWHQDRTIAVTERIDVEGFGPWTVKSGILHVAPPFELLARMVTLRLHIDGVPITNAPLRVAPGSHRMGRIPESEIHDVVKRCGSITCLADPGDIWLYATPILHASDSAQKPDHRRVLQVDFSIDDLPHGLTWLGV
ncbi:MAG: phytanoyl-CoA dioxygenase family protein [Hyphomicrobiaceae bacterium]